ASNAGIGIEVATRAIPVKENVHAACELLGIDPLYVANEGKLVAFVEPSSAPAVLAAMKELPEGRDAAVVGIATDQRPGMVVLKTEVGGTRILDLPMAEQLPRIC